MNDKPPDASHFLRTSLRGNAVFSALSGTLFTLAGSAIAGFLGVEPAVIVTFVGLNLLVFAAALVYVASRPLPPRPLAIAIIAADVLWVVGTLILVFAGVFTRVGAVAALLVANVVLAFAVLQSIGVRRLSGARGTA